MIGATHSSRTFSSSPRHGNARPSRCGCQRGAAAVEMALIMPLFFLLVMGMIEFGMIGFHKLTLTQAARTGVRAASMGKPVSQIVATTQQSVASSMTIPSANIIPEYSVGGGGWMPLTDGPPVNGQVMNGAPPDALVRVRIAAWKHPLITGSFFAWLPGVTSNALPLNSGMTMRRE